MFITGIKELLRADEGVDGKTFVTGYYAIYENGKWGVIDTKQNIVVEPTYDEMIIVPEHSKPIFICTINTNYENNTYETKVLNNKNEELFNESRERMEEEFQRLCEFHRRNEDDLVEQFYRIAKSMIEADLEKEQA